MLTCMLFLCTPSSSCLKDVNQRPSLGRCQVDLQALSGPWDWAFSWFHCTATLSRMNCLYRRHTQTRDKSAKNCRIMWTNRYSDLALAKSSTDCWANATHSGNSINCGCPFSRTELPEANRVLSWRRQLAVRHCHVVAVSVSATRTRHGRRSWRIF